MKTTVYILAFVLLLTTACDNSEDPAPEEDPLIATGLLGKWELQDRRRDGQSIDPNACCVFIEMSANVNTQDNRGSYIMYGAVPNTEGAFTVVDASITFTPVGDSGLTYTFEVTGNMLTLSRTKGNAVESEIYIKR